MLVLVVDVENVSGQSDDFTVVAEFEEVGDNRFQMLLILLSSSLMFSGELSSSVCHLHLFEALQILKFASNKAWVSFS